MMEGADGSAPDAPPVMQHPLTLSRHVVRGTAEPGHVSCADAVVEQRGAISFLGHRHA